MTKKNNNLLLEVEKTSYGAIKSHLDFQNKITDKESVNTIMEFLSISFDQAVLFSCLVELSLQRMVTLEILARHINCSVLRIIGKIPDIDALIEKSYVKKKVKTPRGKPSYNNFSYAVPHNVIESLRISDKSFLSVNPKMNFPNLLEQVKILVKERDDDLISTHDLEQEIESLIRHNYNYTFIKYINRNLCNPTNKCVVLVLAYFHLTGMIYLDVDNTIEEIFDDINDQLEFKRSIACGSNELVEKGLVTYQHSQFGNEQSISISAKTINALYIDYPELKMKETSNIGLIDYKTIVEKRLYFNAYIGNQIANIQSILGKSKFLSFQKTAQNNNINKGVTAIFHGYSGTGKTEAVYQIAKKTGRDIMMVDLSQTKSMWFGESEKQVKKIFDDYNRLLQTCPVVPILFINEVDGLFSKRMEIGNSSTTQTLNTIQNILLQALENFEGILFATTNLTGNLDRAFERRFLFKIEFPKPDKEIRKRIWMNKVPELTPKMAGFLGERFEISGGQIDNHVRQMVLNKVLDKKLDIFKCLQDSCTKESGFSTRKPIGF
jgi:hypothetical protein